ncbi:hypothetical protein, partial [Hominenteromicrobium sp.]|uniref:hypothetical protein n=1 Tax=Hominenteromicrobium sp. TaxID=3073581 RepID=UPI003AF07812
ADVSADDILFVFHFYNSSPRAVSHAFNTRLYKFPFGLNRKLLSNLVYHISPPIAKETMENSVFLQPSCKQGKFVVFFNA